MSTDPKIDRRESIVEAAVSLADSVGLDAVTVRATAIKAGVGIGTLRHHFPTQKDLFDAIVVRRVDAVIDDSVVLDESAAMSDRIASMIEQFIPPELDKPASLNLWFGTYSSALGPKPNIGSQRLLAAAAARSHEHMRRWLRHFAAEGFVRPKDVDDVANTIIALIVGITLESLTPGTPTTIGGGRTLLTKYISTVLETVPAP